MAKPKYIQDTKWWKKVEEKVDAELAKKIRGMADKVILEALTKV